MIRNEKEIQRVHDLLTRVVRGEIPVQLPDENTAAAIHAALDVLCWVLNDDDQKCFAKNLAAIDNFIAGLGLFLEEGPRPTGWTN